MQRVVKISPWGFQVVNDTLLDMSSRGYDDTAAAFAACHAVGLNPKPGDEITFQVDSSLRGPVFPAGIPRRRSA